MSRRSTPGTASVRVSPQVSGTPELLSLIERGEKAEREARRADARTLYERALRTIQSPADAHHAIALTRWIGRTHWADGNPEAGRDCVALSLVIAESLGDRKGQAHGLNLLGIIAQHAGELREASRHYHAARRRAQAAGDQQVLALAFTNLGVLATIRGEVRSALRYYERSLSALRVLGHTENLALTLNNLGMLYTDIRRFADAEGCFGEALAICREHGYVSSEILVEANSAEMWIAQGKLEQALEACGRAYPLSLEQGDARVRGEIHKHYGVIFREIGRMEEAERHLSLASMIAEERGDPLMLGETAREQATLFWSQNRPPETLRSLNLAHRCFTQLSARRDVADVAERLEALEATFLEIVERWGQSIESADRYTQGHCVRVANYACALAREAGMEEETLLWFRMGALLHDVGKIVVPPEILNKPGRYTPEEWALMQQHPDAGVALLADVEFPWDIRPMVRFHHERWAGGGYPTGISGEEIPPAARILAIADVFDALTTDRPYRRGLSVKESLRIMEFEMAGHFAPDLFELWKGLAVQCRFEASTMVS
jgi:putative nucleotidyltransferase with HDIG domain